VDWVRGFYERQYAWADWRTRWADADPDDPAIEAHLEAVRRLTGPGRKQVLELGSGTGNVAAALANAGHDVVAIELLDDLVEHTRRLAESVRTGSLEAVCGDFYEVDPARLFDVVAYFDGFGIGTDDDQRRLLRRIDSWLTPDGSALIDVFSPASWVRSAGGTEEFPPGSGVWYRDRFDPEGSRMIEDMWRLGDEDAVVSQTLRCYSPADLRLLLEGSHLRLAAIEPYSDESYTKACSLDEAMLYLVRLVPVRDAAIQSRPRLPSTM
jgi:SAM-dependent methyltransferase